MYQKHRREVHQVLHPMHGQTRPRVRVVRFMVQLVNVLVHELAFMHRSVCAVKMQIAPNRNEQQNCPVTRRCQRQAGCAVADTCTSSRTDFSTQPWGIASVHKLRDSNLIGANDTDALYRPAGLYCIVLLLFRTSRRDTM